jgi:hypothetical protein
MMIQQLINLLCAVVLCELLIELFKSAAPLAPLRRWLGIEDEHGLPLSCGDDLGGKGCAWYSMLAGCGYCISVWVGVACGIVFGLRLCAAAWMPGVLVYAINGLIVHRLSNVWHAVIHRVADAEGRLRRDMELMGNMAHDPNADPADDPPV